MMVYFSFNVMLFLCIKYFSTMNCIVAVCVSEFAKKKFLFISLFRFTSHNHYSLVNLLHVCASHSINVNSEKKIPEVNIFYYDNMRQSTEITLIFYQQWNVAVNSTCKILSSFCLFNVSMNIKRARTPSSQ